MIMDNLDNELKPIEKEEPKFDFNMELTSNEEEKEKEVSKFIEGFPDWDLLPPNRVIRRVTRK